MAEPQVAWHTVGAVVKSRAGGQVERPLIAAVGHGFLALAATAATALAGLKACKDGRGRKGHNPWGNRRCAAAEAHTQATRTRAGTRGDAHTRAREVGGGERTMV